MDDDLRRQLRAYGRQLDRDKYDTPTGLEPTGPLEIVPRMPGAVDGPPHRRPGWPLVVLAAAVVAVITGAAAVLLPGPAAHPRQASSPGEEMAVTTARTAVTSALAGLCVLTASCSSATPDAATSAVTSTASTSSAPLSTAPISTAPSSPAPSSPAPSSPAPSGTTPAGATDGAPVAVFAGSERSLDPGRYLVDSLTEPLTVDVPAGWKTDGSFFLSRPEQAFVGFWQPTSIYTDACDRGPGRVAVDATATVDSVVAALAAQQHTATTEPTALQIGGVPAVALVVSPEPDSPASCTVHALWTDSVGDGYLSTDGETWRVYVLDLPAGPAVISVGQYAGVSDTTRAEVDAMIGSMTVG